MDEGTLETLRPEERYVKLSAVIYDEVIYPRYHHDPLTVQRYADNLEVIEATKKWISLSSDFKLLDGKHRWLAYQKRHDGDDPEIPVFIYPVTAPHDQLQMAIYLNSNHGLQLSEDEKEADAKKLYAYGMTYETIAMTLHVTKSKVSAWLARTVRDIQESRDKKIKQMWLACHTQEDIATAANCTQAWVAELAKKFISKVLENQTGKSALLANHLMDFEAPQKNIWNQHDKTPHGKFPGSTEPRWVDNLLYFYTQPFDIVVDPFAGSGSTIDVCQKRLRRYWTSDRKPIPERAHEIRLWDMTEGVPPLHNWRDTKLVYLDPPYWKQVEGEYSQDPTDLANMPLDQFTLTLSGIITDFGKKLHTGAHIALIIQPTHWYAPEHVYTDHAMDMVKLVKLPLARRIACPCDTPRYTDYLKWCLETRDMLTLNREIIVWRVP